MFLARFLRVSSSSIFKNCSLEFSVSIHLIIKYNTIAVSPHCHYSDVAATAIASAGHGQSRTAPPPSRSAAAS
jgi:hypothetical protein